MEVYWREETGEVLEQDSRGVNIYKEVWKSGEIVGAAHNNRSGYSNLVIATPNGKFVTVLTCDCTHHKPKEL